MRTTSLRPRPERAKIVAAEKAAKRAKGECSDCHAPAAFKRDGKRARLCDGCLKKDRERAQHERDALAAEQAP